MTTFLAICTDRERNNFVLWDLYENGKVTMKGTTNLVIIEHVLNFMRPGDTYQEKQEDGSVVYPVSSYDEFMESVG